MKNMFDKSADDQCTSKSTLRKPGAFKIDGV